MRLGFAFCEASSGTAVECVDGVFAAAAAAATTAATAATAADGGRVRIATLFDKRIFSTKL